MSKRAGWLILGFSTISLQLVLAFKDEPIASSIVFLGALLCIREVLNAPR